MVKNFEFKDNYDINDLLNIMKILRAPGGCVWDAEQTHSSIKNNMLEEAYEAVDAIENNDMTSLCEELGDVLMQVVFHSEISAEQNGFDFNEVADGVCKKLIYRHPHVFGNVKVENSAEVLNNWDNLKRREKSQDTVTDTLKSVPRSFPSLMYAQKVQKRASKGGMDFSSVEETYNKVTEELEEVKSAVEQKNGIEEELGDLLFSAVNTVRLLGFDAEELLKKSTDKFISRFEKTEQRALENGAEVKDLSQSELDKLWEEVK